MCAPPGKRVCQAHHSVDRVSVAERRAYSVSLIRHRFSLRNVLTTMLGILGILSLTFVSAPVTAAHAAATPANHGNHYQTVTIIGKEDYFVMPTTIRAGLTRFVFTDEGDEAHQAQFFKFKPGYDEADLLNTLNQFLSGTVSFQKVFDETWLVGGIGSIEAGASQTTYQYLTPGNYEVMCFDTDNGVFHFDEGMYKSFTVANPHVGARRPKADGVVVMTNLHYYLPAAIHSHRAITLKVYNAGPAVYEFSLFKLNPGVTYQQYLDCINTYGCNPPITSEGGIPAIEPGITRWIDLHLTPGNYVAASFAPDPATGYYQANEGMVTPFTVN